MAPGDCQHLQPKINDPSTNNYVTTWIYVLLPPLLLYNTYIQRYFSRWMTTATRNDSSIYILFVKLLIIPFYWVYHAWLAQKMVNCHFLGKIIHSVKIWRYNNTRMTAPINQTLSITIIKKPIISVLTF